MLVTKAHTLQFPKLKKLCNLKFQIFNSLGNEFVKESTESI
jgi:hypothetical protein